VHEPRVLLVEAITLTEDHRRLPNQVNGTMRNVQAIQLCGMYYSMRIY